ncbi:hypothetical protein JQ596_29450 [Bradyrhizobium manausense]|uniref:hypothetical protein n=1 Tax=Bradyrhizobium TaxID=374 RepID=UPI001BA8EFA8|nr:MULTISPECIES: hypothetical protein [Bradyrhizobium]MBR0829666.1 hypothetical protein [Bradyrhizobium manausense]UVO25288.1 hypothetical protein KUF59_21985 [Bradyrhizobium arachidis]
MRNSLVTAALAALLALTADVKQPVAQLFPVERPAPQAPAPHNIEKTKAVTRADGKPHRKRRVVRPAPNQRKVAEKKGYERVSDLVNFPKFFPGLGVLLVKPETLPLGPFLCFDRRDRLVATLYMVPTKEIDNHNSLEAPGFVGKVDHVSIYFNPGHPGVDLPHYHIMIWHVSKWAEARVAK